MARRSQRLLRQTSLHGGVSRQPASQRFPTQVEDAINFNFSVFVNGAPRRPGTCFVRQTLLLAEGGDYLIHEINRDGTEKYNVVYGNDGDDMGCKLRVFTDTGIDATVNATGAALTYLMQNNPTADQIRCVTIADATLIVNTTVPTGTLASDTFTVAATVRDYEVLISQNPGPGDYYEVEEDIEAAPAGFFQFVDDGLTFASYRFENTRSDFNRPSGYSRADIQPMGFDIGFRRVAINLTAATYDNSTKRITQAGAFADYEPVDGDAIYIDGGDDELAASIPVQWRIVASKISDDVIELQDSILKSDGSTAITTGTDITSEAIGLYATVRKTFDTTPLTMADVALEFQQALESGGARDARVFYTNTTSFGFFTIVSPFRGDDARVYAATAPKEANGITVDSGVENLVSSDRCFGTGGAAETTDGTGVVDEMHPERLDPEERWTRVSPPGQVGARPDPAKMPVKLTRVSIDPLVFALETIDWTARGTGTAITNKAHRIFTEELPIADIGFIRGRLMLVGGEYSSLSQAEDLFNFYKDDAGNIADADPIDISLGGDRVALFDYISPFRETAVAFTKAGRQFELSNPESLTPSSASWTPSTSYETLSVRPQQLGSLLYFLTSAGPHARLREYFFDADRLANYANDVTAHAEDYLPSNIRSIATCPNLNVAVILPEESSELFIYQTFWSGTDKQQSAWTKWSFDPSFRIADIAVIGETLHMLVEREDIGWCFEKISLTNAAADCCAAAGDYAIPEAPGGGGDPGDGGTDPPPVPENPLTPGRYYTALGLDGNAPGVLRHNDDDTHTDLSSLFAAGIDEQSWSMRMYHFSEYDADSLYVCGNIRDATVPGGPRVLRWNGDGLESIGKNLSGFLANPNPSLAQGVVTAMAYFKGTLYAAVSMPNSVSAFTVDITLLALVDGFWEEVTTFEAAEGEVVRMREVDDKLWACIGGDLSGGGSMWKVRPGTPARYCNYEVWDTIPILFEAAYFGSLEDVPLMVGALPDTTDGEGIYLGGVGALDTAIVEGSPLTEVFTFDPQGGGFVNNDDDGPANDDTNVDGAVCSNGGRSWTAALTYGGNHYVCGRGGSNFFSIGLNAPICYWDGTSTLTDQTGEGPGGIDVQGGNAWISAVTYPHRSGSYASTYINDMCVDGTVIYGVGRMQHLRNTGFTPNCEHFIRNPTAGTPNANWQKVPNVPSWVLEIIHITAISATPANIVNTHDKGSEAPE